MVDSTTVGTDLANESTAHERHVGSGRHVHRSHTRHRMVGVGHLLFDVEITRRAQTLHHEVGAEFARCVDGETRKGRDSRRGQMGDARPDESHPSLEIDDTGRFARIVHRGDHHGTEQFDRLFHDVEVTDVERIETPWIQGGERGRGGHAHVKVPVQAASVRRTKATQVRL